MKENIEYKLTIAFICPVTKESSMQIVNSDDISSREQECELCGSHGSIDVTILCESCSKAHNFKVSSW